LLYLIICKSKNTTINRAIKIPRLRLFKVNPSIPAIDKNTHKKKGMIGESFINDKSI